MSIPLGPLEENERYRCNVWPDISGWHASPASSTEPLSNDISTLVSPIAEAENEVLILRKESPPRVYRAASKTLLLEHTSSPSLSGGGDGNKNLHGIDITETAGKSISLMHELPPSNNQFNSSEGGVIEEAEKVKTPEAAKIGCKPAISFKTAADFTTTAGLSKMLVKV